MALADSVKRLISRKKSIDKISLDELRRERIKLEQEESKMAHRIEDLEKRKEALLLKGKDDSSQRQQLLIARKYKEYDVMAQNYDKNMQLFSKQLRIINGFIQIKENQKLLHQAGISSLVNKMDLVKLQQYVEKSTVDGQFYLDKFSDILATLEESGELVGVTPEDPDVLEIVKVMQELKTAEAEDPEGALKESKKKADRILHKEEPEGEL